MKSIKSVDSVGLGPGAYDSISSIEFRGIVTPKTARFPRNSDHSPGLGCYNSFSPRSTTGSTFSKSNRGSLFSSQLSPGPGRYEIVKTDRAPSFTFSRKYKSKISDTPGPGAYSYRFITKKSNASTIGTEKRKELVQILDTPGPGKYESRVIRDTPSWSFSRIKDAKVNSSTPGPGKYDINISSRSGACITPRAPRLELFDFPQSPGPGRYSLTCSLSPKIKCSIGKAKRPEISSFTPGPGKYEPVNLSKSFSLKFGTEPKRTLEVITETANAPLLSPMKIMKKSPSYSIGKKLITKSDNGVPGPGSYNAEKRVKSPSGKIGKSFRFIKTFTEKEILENPGPGTYEISTSQLTAKAYISKSKRELHKVNHNPGPGQYHIN